MRGSVGAYIISQCYFLFPIFPLFLMYERECWSIHYFSVRGTIDRWRRWTILQSASLFYSSSQLLVSFLLPSLSSLLAPTTLWNGYLQHYGLTHLRVFTFTFLCAFPPHISLQLVTILIIHVVSMNPWLNVCTRVFHFTRIFFDSRDIQDRGALQGGEKYSPKMGFLKKCLTPARDKKS